MLQLSFTDTILFTTLKMLYSDDPTSLIHFTIINYMSTQIIKFERRFQIWKYTVGHTQLLLRSTKSPDFPTRIDVLFKGVEAFHMPTTFTGLSIAEASEEEFRTLCSLRPSPCFGKSTKVLKVQGSDFLGYVAASVVVCHEDEGEYDDPSFFSKENIL